MIIQCECLRRMRHLESPICIDLVAGKGQNVCLGACQQGLLLLTELLVSTVQGCLVCISPFCYSWWGGQAGSGVRPASKVPFIDLTKSSQSLNPASPKHKEVSSQISLLLLLYNDIQYAMEPGCFLTSLFPNVGHQNS